MMNGFYINKALRLLSLPVLICIFSLLSSARVFAVADGDLDTTFETNSGTINGFDSPPTTLAFQEDGKMLVGGQFRTYRGVSAPYILRLNSDGSLDATFSLEGEGLNSYVRLIAIQEDGKILLAGRFTSYNGVYNVDDILRLNTDGSLDTTFISGLGCDSRDIYTMKILEDGKILIGGTFLTFNGVSAKYFARLNTDGSVDTSFVQEGSGFQNEVELIEVQEDGKYIVGGDFTSYNGTNLPGVARLNTDGSLDTSFVPFFSYGGIDLIAIQPDGKILIGGFITDGERPTMLISRLNSDGSEDTTFSTGAGFTQYDSGEYVRVYSMIVQSDGKIVVSGNFTWYDLAFAPYMARLNSDGTLDTSFYHSDIGFNYSVTSLSVASNGDIFALGSFLSYDVATCPYLVSMDSGGNVKDTFLQYPDGFNGPVTAIEVQPDGKIIVGGAFTTYNGIYSPHVARLSSDGLLDSSFVQTGKGLFGYGPIFSIMIQEDGKILVGGFFYEYNDTPVGYFVRLNTDGSLDTSFDMGTGFDDSVVNILLQNDGKILIAGEFNSYNGTAAPGIIRLNSDGSVDTSFAINQELEYSRAIALQEDGKIIVIKLGSSTGDFPLRLNSDGSVDTSFNVEALSFNQSIDSVVLQDDGGILVSGYFSTYGEEEVLSFVRLNTDGSLDTTFHQNAIMAEEFGFLVFPTIQLDGKILIEKLYLDIDTMEYVPSILRLNTDGSLDDTFAVNLEPFSILGVETSMPCVYDMEILANGKILIAGGFTSYQENDEVAYLARLNIYHVPMAPSLLKVDNTTNPTGVLNLTPSFSALVTDTNTSDTILKYQIQVNTNSLFTGTSMWDSGIQTFTTPVVHNSRTPDIPYGGNALTLDGTKYYWRMRVWDSMNDVSEWSVTNDFTMALYSLNAPFGLTISPSTYTNVNSFRFTWAQGNARVKSYEYKTGTSGSSWIATAVNSVPLLAYKNGQNTVQIRGVDNAGNRSVASAISYYYDSIAPSVPTNLSVTENSFSWTESTDASSGIAGYEYRVGDLLTWTSTDATTVLGDLGLQEGENILYVRALDRVGNKSETAMTTYLYEENPSEESTSTTGPIMSFTREGSENPIQNNTIAVKSGEAVTVTIPVSAIVIEGDSVSEVYVEIEGQRTILVLDEEKKAYTAKVTIPTGKTKGSTLEIAQVIEYASGERNVKGVSIVIDPYGYVYTKSNGKENRLENAQVSLYSYDNGNKILYVFNDGTQNPQSTNSNGEYSYFVPNGEYILVVELEGYKTYTSDMFEVSSGAVEQNIEMKKKLPMSVYLIGGGVLVLIGVGLFIAKRKESV